jgi:hypothetical protein
MRTYLIYGGWISPGFIVVRAPEKGVRWRQQMIAARRLLRRLYYSDTRRAFEFYVDGDEDGKLWEHAGKSAAPRYEWRDNDWQEYKD